MFSNIHKKKWARIVAAYIVLNLLAEFTMPVAAFALTSGPAQEEFASFEPASTSDMVDLYTGDFTYNLPLLSVPGPNGGYPINLAYHSGIGMEQEASWVGLGWNINVGAINRNLRGLPDDFAGETVTTVNRLKKDWTVGLNLPSLPFENFVKDELWGVPQNVPPGQSQRLYSQIYFNSYRGIGARATLSFQSSKKEILNKFQLQSGLNLVFDSQSGIGISPSMSVEAQSKILENKTKGTYSLNFNSREGFQGSSFTHSTSLKGIQHNIHDEFADNSAGMGSSTMSFGGISGVPSVGLPMNNTTVNFGLYFNSSSAVEMPGSFLTRHYSSISGSYNETEVADNGYDYRPAYGFLNLGTGDDSDRSITDMERKNIPYSKKVPNLAPSSMTYDLFMMTGQGTGGMFRPIRSQAAIVHSPINKTQSKSLSAELEFGTSQNTTHIGLGISVGSGLISSGNWQSVGLIDDNQTLISGYDDISPNSLSNYESWYFQMIGEKSGVLESDDFLTKWGGGDVAHKVALSKYNDMSWSDRQFVATNKLGTSEASPATVTLGAGSRAKPIRAARSTNIETSYVSDILNMQIPNIGTKVNVRSGYSSSTQLSRSQLLANRPGSHIAELSTLQSDGMRYNYGLPAYNEIQKEVTFILDQTPGLGQNTTNTPIPSSQINANSISTANIYNEYYSETNLPAYAHSWLLTSVVSSDYVDITGNGPSEDDYGYWVKFNYVKASSPYSWRVPYHGVKYIQGNQNDPTDDMGYYSYGEKQVFFLDKVETKTHIAVFNLGERKDSKEAPGDVNANSGTGADAMRRIESISLYSKAEYNANTSTAVPIKTVHFSYDYSLCPNVNNNDGTPEIVNSVDLNANKGKLTLKKVWFTYLNSSRGEISPYQFTYSSFNPAYNQGDMDRWGNYKANSSSYSSVNYPYLNYPVTDQADYRTPSNPQSLENSYSNSPFANRSEELASAWALTSIRLPSGGTMDIKYELDDYSYTEDKTALEFYDITTQSASDDRSGNNTTAIDNTSANSSADNNYRVYFKLREPLPSNYINSITGSNYIRDHYIKGINQVYFRTFTKLLGNTSLNKDNSWDYVSGWADIIVDNTDIQDYIGVESASVGYLTLKKEGLNEINIMNNTVGATIPPFVHPFRKAGFQHLKSNRQELLYNTVPYANDWKDKVVNTVSAVLPVANELATAIVGGFNNIAFAKGYSTEMRLNGYSVIRLSDNDGKKYGGGVRIKQLSLDDHWVKSVSGNVPTEDSEKYGQTYSYKMADGTSSGVAYEPLLGKDENALFTPVEYPLSTKIKNPQQLYIEKPVLDNYYPAPGVGYRRVIVKSLAPNEALNEAVANSLPANDLLHSSAPVSEYLFYSPKDFPVYFDQTDLNSDPAILRPMFIPGFYSGFVTRKARTQGYLIELNDMAGKPRMIATYTRNKDQYDELGKLISKVEFFYETKAPYNADIANRLSSKVRVVKPGSSPSADMIYDNAVIGQTEEVFIDMHEDLQRSRTIGLDVNLEILSAPSTPGFFLMPIPTASHFEASMRTIVTHKIVHRSGLLKETVVTTDESVISTKNLAYDLETAQPILTQVTNDFKDDVFNIAYPAHWYYPGMQGAYRNYRVKLDMPANTTLSVGNSGRVDLTPVMPSGKTAHDYFEPGDEVYIDFATGSADGLYWVYKVGPNVSGNSYIDLMAANGALVPNSATIKNLTVLRSGHRNMVSASVGDVAFKTINGFTPWTPSAGTSGTFTFDDVINASAVQYSDFWASDCKNCTAEFGFTSDVVNPYRNGILGNWRAYKSYAYRTQREQNDNIRKDGTYADFNAFDWRNPASSHPNWILASTVTMYSPFGFELENRDPLGNYSSATYEYNSSLATMVGSNARYREIGSDGFEDYQMLSACLQTPANLVNYDHWGFGNYMPKLKTNEHHTGRYSLELLNGESAENAYDVFSGTEYDALMDPLRMYQLTWNDLVSTTMPLNNPYCTGKVRYTPGKTYVVGGWIKQSGGPLPVNTASNYTSGQIEVQFYNGASLVSTQTISANDNTIIDGWQRLQGTFTVPASGVTVVKVVLRNTATLLNTPVYFDDLRVHPFDGQAKTFVYDQTTLKLMAELDENNYATFYNYDDEGHLVKVRKETRDGIKTLKEGRINTRTNY